MHFIQSARKFVIKAKKQRFFTTIASSVESSATLKGGIESNCFKNLRISEYQLIPRVFMRCLFNMKIYFLC